MMIQNIATQLATSVVHPKVVDWVYRVVQNGGPQPSEKSVKAVNKFYNSCVSNAIDSKLLLVNVFAPDSLSGCMVPLVSISGSGVWSNSNFVDADLNISGLAGNGTNKFLDTHWMPGKCIPAGDGGIAIMVSVDRTGVANECGATDVGGANALRLYYHYADNNTYVNMYGGNINTIITTGPLTGYIGAYRTSTTNFNCYFGNSISGHKTSFTNVASMTQVPTKIRPLFVFATNEGTTNNFSAKRISFFAMTKGLTSGESFNLYNAVQQLRQDFGGGYT